MPEQKKGAADETAPQQHEPAARSQPAMPRQDSTKNDEQDARGSDGVAPVAGLTAAENKQRVGHTPGPWRVLQGSDERDFIVAEATGNTVCEPNAACYSFADLDPSVRDIPLDEAKVNAHLIAAAPDLLAALNRALNWLSSYPGGNAEGAYNEARAAIAKAEGH